MPNETPLPEALVKAIAKSVPCKWCDAGMALTNGEHLWGSTEKSELEVHRACFRQNARIAIAPVFAEELKAPERRDVLEYLKDYARMALKEFSETHGSDLADWFVTHDAALGEQARRGTLEDFKRRHLDPEYDSDICERIDIALASRAGLASGVLGITRANQTDAEDILKELTKAIDAYPESPLPFHWVDDSLSRFPWHYDVHSAWVKAWNHEGRVSKMRDFLRAWATIGNIEDAVK